MCKNSQQKGSKNANLLVCANCLRAGPSVQAHSTPRVVYVSNIARNKNSNIEEQPKSIYIIWHRSWIIGTWNIETGRIIGQSFLFCKTAMYLYSYVFMKFEKKMNKRQSQEGASMRQLAKMLRQSKN